MNIKKMMVYLAFIVALTFLFGLTGCGNDVAEPVDDEDPAAEPDEDDVVVDDQEVYTLDFTCSWEQGNVNYEYLEVFKDFAEEVTDGRLNINIIGGPEVFPPLETAEAVISGAADGAYTSSGYSAGYIPAAQAIDASMMTFPEMVESGGIDVLRDAYDDAGLFLYAVPNEVTYSPFHIWLTEPIEGVDDIQGLRLRAAPGLYNEFVSTIGATPITTTLPELYPALEQGMLDGYIVPIFIGGDQGFFEHAKYLVKPGFSRGGGTIIINPEAWDGLPEDLQELLLEESTTLADKWDNEVAIRIKEDNLEMFEAAGGEIIELPSEDAEEMKDTFYDLAWELVHREVPGKAEELEETLR